jgi:allantoate deiminase
MSGAEYVLDLCARIAAHTDVPGTITRTFLSPATRGVHALLRTEMQAAGMQVRVDCAGNVRGFYAGEEAGAPVLLVGSHIDTVPAAGAYDGVLGVAVAIGLVRELAGRRLPFAIEAIAFSEEEGVRFALPFIGSRALLGSLAEADLERRDAAGVSVAQALGDFGLDAKRLLGEDSDPRFTPGTFAFLEVHIEQGPVLDSLGIPLGIVATIIGQSRLALTFHGEANHAGTTPMAFRRDALAAAAAWMGEVESSPERLGDPGLLATVGFITAAPGAANVIPGAASVTLDVRHPENEARLRAVRHLRERAEAIAAARGLTVEITDRGGQSSVPMDGGLTEMLAEAAAGYGPHRMASGAGHDAMILAPALPAAMLFVRSPGGISHNPAESVRGEDVQAALEVGLRFFDALATADVLLRTGAHA